METNSAPIRRLTADEIDKQFRRAIESEMERRTQDGLALDAGISPPTLHHFRTGERTMKWPAAAALIAALGLELRPRRVVAIQTRIRKPKRSADDE